MSYRSIKLNGKLFQVHDSVASELERLWAIQKSTKTDVEGEDPEMEEEVEDMETEEKKKKDMEMKADPEKEDEEEDMEKKKKDMDPKEKMEAKKKDMPPAGSEEDEDKEDMGGEDPYLKTEGKKPKKNEASSLKSKIEVLEGQNAALRARIKKNSKEDKASGEVSDRVKVINSAAKILNLDSSELVGESVLDIKTRVVNELYPEIETDGKTEEFLNGVYETAISDQGKTYTKMLDNAVSQSLGGYFKEGEKVKSVANMEMEAFNKRKDMWKEPIAPKEKGFEK